MTTELVFRKPAGFSYYFINGELPEHIRKGLDIELSYTVKNADFAMESVNEKTLSKWRRACEEARLHGRPAPPYPELWDGKVRFLYKAKSGSYYFPVGMLPRVTNLMKWYDVTVKIDAQYNESGLKGEFEWSGPDMRGYQIDALQKLIAHNGGIASIPTAGGKTLIFLRLAYAMSVNTIILVHRKELLKQWCREIEKTIKNVVPFDYGSDAIKGYIQMRDDREDNPMIVIAMIPTLAGADKNKNAVARGILNTRFGLLCVDESHHTPSETFYTVASKFDVCVKVGLSATPERDDGDDMKAEAVLGPIRVNMKAEDLIDDGFLARPLFEFIDVQCGSCGSSFPEVYKTGVVLNEHRNKAIAGRVGALVAEGRQVYIHVEHIKHGQLLSKMMNVPFIYSKSLDRDAAIENFRSGKTRVLISTLLGEGVDIPTISAIVMAGGRKTSIGTIQKVGRTLRPKQDGETAIVVDFSDKGKYLSDHTMARYNCYCKTYGEDIVRGRKPEMKK